MRGAAPLGVLAVVLAGCGMAIPGLPDACTLVVHDVWADEAVLAPPYRTVLHARPGGPDENRIAFSGTGWGTTHAEMSGPGKHVEGDLDAERLIDTGSPDDAWHATVWIVDAPGTWLFRFTSDGCSRELAIDVAPVP